MFNHFSEIMKDDTKEYQHPFISYCRGWFNTWLNGWQHITEDHCCLCPHTCLVPPPTPQFLHPAFSNKPYWWYIILSPIGKKIFKTLLFFHLKCISPWLTKVSILLMVGCTVYCELKVEVCPVRWTEPEARRQDSGENLPHGLLSSVPQPSWM